MESYLPLVKHLLPDFILSYCELLRVESVSDVLHLYLQEKNYEETDMVRKHLLSQGFLLEITIQDFPIQDKRVFLHITTQALFHKPLVDQKRCLENVVAERRPAAKG